MQELIMQKPNPQNLSQMAFQQKQNRVSKEIGDILKKENLMLGAKLNISEFGIFAEAIIAEKPREEPKVKK